MARAKKTRSLKQIGKSESPERAEEAYREALETAEQLPETEPTVPTELENETRANEIEGELKQQKKGRRGPETE